MRILFGIVGGIAAGLLAIIVIAYAGEMLFPGAAVDAADVEGIVAAFPSIPLTAKLIIVLSWFGGALVGAMVAKKISGSPAACWTVAGLFALYVLASVAVLPMPGWLQVIAVVAPLVGGLLANHLVRGPALTPAMADDVQV